MSMREQSVHAVLVPGPAVGHVNGMILLSRALLQAGFQVTLVRFHRSYEANSNYAPSLPAGVAFHVLPDGLSVSSDQRYVDIFANTSLMHDSLRELLRSTAPPASCIIADPMMAWTQNVADEYSLPRLEFSPSSATSHLVLMAFSDLRAKLKHTKEELPKFLDCIPGLPSFPSEELPPEILALDDSTPAAETASLCARHIRCANRVLVLSVRDLERSSFQAFTQLGISAIPMGPFITPDLGSTSECMAWLDRHVTSSVIYVAFGSNVELSREEVLELALGLEASGQPFVWALRNELLVELPGGWQDRLAGKGLIIPWAPQVAALGHPAVGGFVTHCGWNSVLESVWTGVPMLAYPKRADQFMNARMLVEVWGVGLRLVWKEPLTRSWVDAGVKALMYSEEGRVALSKVQELSKVVRKASRESYSSLLELKEQISLQVKTI